MGRHLDRARAELDEVADLPSQAELNWDEVGDPNPDVERDERGRQRTRGQQALDILADMLDPDECWFDHHGGCQAHGWYESGECPQARAKRLLGRS